MGSEPARYFQNLKSAKAVAKCAKTNLQRLQDDRRRQLDLLTSLKDDFVFPPFSVLDTEESTHLAPGETTDEDRPHENEAGTQVLNARSGPWQDRKRAWLALGIRSELGRGANLLELSETNAAYLRGCKGPTAKVSPGGSPRPATRLGKDGRTVRGDGAGHALTKECLQRNDAQAYPGLGGPNDLRRKYKNAAIPGGGTGKNSAWLFRTEAGYEATEKRPVQSASVKGGLTVGITCGAYREPGQETSAAQGTGTSIFDPVLCELMYKWFCPRTVGQRRGRILDPFAGGSVRGIVASYIGLEYTGVDLSERQLESNYEQAAAIVPELLPRWICGDARRIQKLVGREKRFDFLFSCPPYFDLERYSDDPADLSTLSPEEFIDSYHVIIRRCLELLKPNRFACFVVGNTRTKDHGYSHLPWHTTQAFEDCGARLYNDAVLLTAVGSLPLRTRKQFTSGRKLGRTHQNVLVFVKGDWRKAAKIVQSSWKKTVAESRDEANKE